MGTPKPEHENAVTHIDFSIVWPRGLNQMAHPLNISISPTIKQSQYLILFSLSTSLFLPLPPSLNLPSISSPPHFLPPPLLLFIYLTTISLTHAVH